MTPRPRLLAFFGAAAACATMNVTAVLPQPKAGLSCTLSVASPSGSAGGVKLTFALRNHGDRAARVLGWNTPFDGWFGDYLGVTRDGIPVAYEGPVVKRGAPAREDYTTVKAGGQRSATIDLAEAYAVTQPGRYRVTFRGVLHDVRFEGPARADSLNPVTLDCGVAEFSIGVAAGR